MCVDMSRSFPAKTEELMESQMDKVRLQSMLEMHKEMEMQRREHFSTEDGAAGDREMSVTNGGATGTPERRKGEAAI